MATTKATKTAFMDFLERFRPVGEGVLRQRLPDGRTVEVIASEHGEGYGYRIETPGGASWLGPAPDQETAMMELFRKINDPDYKETTT
jgi:hypothetical protein